MEELLLVGCLLLLATILKNQRKQKDKLQDFDKKLHDEYVRGFNDGRASQKDLIDE